MILIRFRLKRESVMDKNIICILCMLCTVCNAMLWYGAVWFVMVNKSASPCLSQILYDKVFFDFT